MFHPHRNFSPPSSLRGFTLVEVLIVIGLIAVLATLLGGAIESVRSSSKLAQCQANLRSISVGMHQYANDHNNWMPPHLETVTKPDKTRIYPLWYAWIAPYITAWDGTNYETTPIDKIFYCPANAYPYDRSLTYYGPLGGSDHSYGYVYRFLTSQKNGNFVNMPPIPRSQVKEPSKMALVVDIPNIDGGVRREPGLREVKTGWIHPAATTVSTRHRGGSNILFLDGHLEWRAGSDILGENYDARNWNPYNHTN